MRTITSEEFLKGGKPKLSFNAKEAPDIMDKPGFFERAGTALKERAGELKKTFGEVATGRIHPLEGSTRFLGDVAGSVGDIAGAAISPQVEKLAQTEFARPAFEALGQGMEKYEQWKGSSETNRRVAEMIEATVNIADLVGGAKAGSVALKSVRKGVDVGVEGVKATGKALSDLELGERATKMFASEPSEQVKNILKEAPSSKFDEFVEIARKSSEDFKAPTGFEIVGDKLADATKQIKKQMSSLGQQKSEILSKAKVGLAEFKDAPRKAILAVSKLEDNPLKAKIISKLKSIKTKADADKVIDDIQDMIYSATDTKLIAQGSRLEKQLRKIIGEMNGQLKDSLPSAYKVLNDKYAGNIDALKKLNRSLGDVIEGVPLRGASLIKQFFSPAGRTTKELFEFVKKNTGIDLAQETVLAKFTAELFDDPKVRSLLEGLPRSRTGVVEKGVEVISEKTGIGERLRDIIRKGNIKKAREITKP